MDHVFPFRKPVSFTRRICGMGGDILFAVVKLSLRKYDLVNQAAMNMGDKLSQEQDVLQR